MGENEESPHVVGFLADRTGLPASMLCTVRDELLVPSVLNEETHQEVGFAADRTGLEPATSAVTGRHSNQLNYRSVQPCFSARRVQM